MCIFWSYSSASPLTECGQSASICTLNNCSKLGIRKTSDASLIGVCLILLHLPCTWVSHKWCTFVIQGQSMTPPDIDGSVNDGICESFAIYQQQIVGANHLQSQYHTSLERKDTIVSPPSSQDQHTSHCGWGLVQCNWRCWSINMHLSHCQCVAIWKYWWRVVAWTYSSNSNWYMGCTIHPWRSGKYYSLFNQFPELLNANCLPPCFKFDQADRQFLFEPHPLIQCDAINLSLQLIWNSVPSSDRRGGGFSLSIG